MVPVTESTTSSSVRDSNRGGNFPRRHQGITATRSWGDGADDASSQMLPQRPARDGALPLLGLCSLARSKADRRFSGDGLGWTAQSVAPSFPSRSLFSDSHCVYVAFLERKGGGWGLCHAKVKGGV
ncbi:uncharacterized protein DS421_5g143310 [Arachis hypogaea]|nr:uncharacterized protein DS421_5g143310 [Arachis hypogaea]